MVTITRNVNLFGDFMPESVKVKKNYIYLIAVIVVIAALGGVLLSQPQQPARQEVKAAKFLVGTDAAAFDGPQVKQTEIININDGDTFELSADVVSKEINGRKYVMYGYNGMIPGPTLRLRQGSNIKIVFKNKIDQNTTIHWHGLRHENKNDGVPGVTQDPVKPGEIYTYDIFVPDEGVYWYHPHIREDAQQDGGLYGNIIVIPANSDAYSKVNKEEMLVLDDILIDEGKIIQYDPETANHALMGRFGTVTLVNGKTDYKLSVNKGDTVRFYITNVANTRPFNLSIQDAKMKLVGSDVSRYEKEMFVNSVVIAPAERYIIEAMFDNAGVYQINNINPHFQYTLGTIEVGNEIAKNDYSADFAGLKENNDVANDISDFEKYFSKSPDYSLKLTVQMDSMMAGMPCHRMADGTMMGDCDSAETKEIEWEDDMGFMNANSNSEDVKWVIQDSSGKENMDIPMNAKVGDVIKIRIFNDPKSMHPMQHPIHLHGQRFLVLRSNDIENENLVWKDTALIKNGETIDLLVDVTNLGEWMLHCHIAEHLESGMMSSFNVEN